MDAAIILSSAGELQTLATSLAKSLQGADPDRHQMDIYELAFLAAEAAAVQAVGQAAAAKGAPLALATIAAGSAARSARERAFAMQDRHDLAFSNETAQATRRLIAEAGDDGVARTALEQIDSLDDLGLPEDLRFAAREFRRFGTQVVAPLAESIHRNDADIPDELINGLAAMGAFGLSIPSEYGGTLDPHSPDHRPMVVATEELSRASLGAGGSLITRPEILTRALMAGGTDEQKSRWLPAIASGERLVAVAVTEPDAGSDVAAITFRAVRDDGGWVLSGTKMWCTFAGRADLLMVLARTDPDLALGHRGLSLFIVEKPRFLGNEFLSTQEGGGSISARAIPTIGYRGMHSFEVKFDRWRVQQESLIGGPAGVGRGFHLQMQAFGSGRLQTAARAVGIMRSAFEAALDHSRHRRVFGHRLCDLGITRSRLAVMAGAIARGRLTTLNAAIGLTDAGGDQNAAMVKALTCRDAESVTRNAMQIFGGYGYAEEYAVSRLFVDARVLSIFEGTEEVLAIKVIAPKLLAAHN